MMSIIDDLKVEYLLQCRMGLPVFSKKHLPKKTKPGPFEEDTNSRTLAMKEKS